MEILLSKIKAIAKSTKQLAKDDPRRVIHSLKVGLALTLVSLFYYVRPLYDGFEISAMWAVLTVVVVLEFTVGQTLSRGLNRSCATLLAGALGIGATHLASLFGKKGQPVVLGILVFLLAAVSTFTRFFPKIKAKYDYGILIFILTFSMVTVSGSRTEDIFEMAYQRLSTILIGGAICIIVSIFVCPVWAGQELHNSVVSSLQKLANYLQGFRGEYFHDSKLENEVSNSDKSVLHGYKSILNSKNSEESLANFARWEPAHGRFGLRHPWKQYLKIGGLARQCAYKIEALNSFIDSDTHVKSAMEGEIKESCMKMSSESSKTLEALATAIKNMTDPNTANLHLESSKKAVSDLKTTLNNNREYETDILAILPWATVISTMIEIVDCVDKISEAVHELSVQAHFKKQKSSEGEVLKQPHNLLHRGSVNPVVEYSSHHVVIEIDDPTTINNSANNSHSNGLNRPLV